MMEGYMKSYITCPECGTKLGKAEEIKDMDFQCPRCRENLIVNVSSVGVIIQRANLLKETANVNGIKDSV